MSRRRIGTVEQVDGRFRARLRVDGKLETVGRFDSAEEADDAINAYARRIAIKSPFVGVTLTEYGRMWLDDRAKTGVHRAMLDARSVWSARIDTAPFACLPLVAITPQDIRDWLREQIRTPSERTGRRAGRQTIANALNLLRVALADAVEEGRIDANPAREARVPKMAKADERWAWLREPEMTALMTCALIPIERRDLFTFAIYTGMRAGEIFGLLWEDVDLERGNMTIRHSWRGTPTKTGHVRQQDIFEPARQALIRQRARVAESAYVWPSATGKPHARGFDGGLAKWLRVAGVQRKVRFHDLRHTCASHLISGTWGRAWSLPETAVRLGHMSSTTTQRYAHMSPDGLRRAFDETPISARNQLDVQAKFSIPSPPAKEDR